MSEQTDDLPAVLGALEPYLRDVILIGGWVPELYKRFGSVKWNGPVSRTTEFDVLVGARLPRDGRDPLRSLLEAHGLRPARKESFPADWVSSESDVTAVEFITNRVGPFGDDGARQIEEQGWLGAIVVENADLLAAFTRTLEVRVSRRNVPVPVRVPTLGAWAVSKALTYGARRASIGTQLSSDKRAKDLLYIRDVVFAGGNVLKQVETDIRDIAAVPRWHTLLRNAIAMLAPVADAAADQEVAKAALEFATRDGTSNSAAAAEIRSGAHELSDLINESLRKG